mmetsp:Transcript_4818/g.14521  ORF Transcript_4818/g.14521 Transcript_4818/m.14521 type:complete len:252 (-) Transcript_4818:327-1082(-)|eukprot:CAMPEP_0198730092 /NCGR_PEP_ID=MMETSP1475-20131203/22778_1 /TAXON_ID= ORGANISM="Unidentified sp., Strain CCMP1999" /NCGR_SAMPLE_ID=MMETSP1475 /ASSEMBLY_ACC=CAM_ASM_001111 /LENGTH=251 /DNA_ID=CAMNT_0044492855 /DNA_START=94 /DNA_END=849 /DNA_ORIENTATION=-
MLAHRLAQLTRAGRGSSLLRGNAAAVLVRWKSSFESEKVRGASSLATIMDEYPPVPKTIENKELPVEFEDKYYEKPHLIDPMDKTKRANTYLILGAPKFIAASVARSVVLSFVYSMSASADVLALGTVEVDLGGIPEGSTATIKWRGKPVFIRHRTEDQVTLAVKDDEGDLRDPEPDAVRCKDPKWMVVLGVCTHLGCVPVADAGDYGGWFCPCHGSHYDISGRIRKGPAPTNLEVPPYSFIEDGSKLLLG